MKLFQREPALALALIVSVVSLIGTFGFPQFTQENAAAVVILLNALGAAAAAWTTRPIAIGPFAALVSAIVALGVTYNLNLPPATLVAINATVYPLLMFITRGQVSPVETAITKQSEDPFRWPRGEDTSD